MTATVALTVAMDVAYRKAIRKVVVRQYNGRQLIDIREFYEVCRLWRIFPLNVHPSKHSIKTRLAHECKDTDATTINKDAYLCPSAVSHRTHVHIPDPLCSS